MVRGGDSAAAGGGQSERRGGRRSAGAGAHWARERRNRRRSGTRGTAKNRMPSAKRHRFAVRGLGKNNFFMGRAWASHTTIWYKTQQHISITQDFFLYITKFSFYFQIGQRYKL